MSWTGTASSYPTPRSAGPRCEATAPDAGQCQLVAPHVNKSHMAITEDAILTWGLWDDEVHRWPLHTVMAWIRNAPWRPEFRP